MPSRHTSGSIRLLTDEDAPELAGPLAKGKEKE